MSLGHLPTYGWVSKHHEQGQWWLLRVSKTEIWLCFVYFYLSNPEHKRILRKAKCQHLLGIHAFARSWQRLSSRHTCPDKKFEESNHLPSDNSFKGQGMVESSSQLQGQASWEGWKQSLDLHLTIASMTHSPSAFHLLANQFSSFTNWI